MPVSFSESKAPDVQDNTDLAVLVANFEFAGFAPKQNYMAWTLRPFSWKRSVLQNPNRERTNQSARICLRLALPYMRFILIYLLAKTFCSEGKIKESIERKPFT